MATDTITVTVRDIITGAILRESTTAKEARRASDPTTRFYGMTMLDIMEGKNPTRAQRDRRAKRTARRAQELAQAEMLAFLADAENDATMRNAHKAERANGNGVVVVARDYDGNTIGE